MSGRAVTSDTLTAATGRPTEGAARADAFGAAGTEVAHAVAARLRTPRGPLGFGRKALLVGLLTASFDVFLVADIGGFTLRIHQLMLGIAVIAALQLTYAEQPIRGPVGIGWLMLWVAFILAFIPNTVYLARSIGYGLWLLLDVFIVLVTVQLFGNGSWIRTLLRTYLRVFVCVGAFAMLQLVLGVLRLPDPFVKQWLIAGVWPRLNGFSYEPSYFSTYMLMGWVFSAWLLERKTYVLGRQLTLAAFAVTSFALVFSTSRIGWIMMFIWGIGYAFRRLRTRHTLSIPPAILVTVLMGFGVLATGLTATSDRLQKALVNTFAGGTGLNGTPAHSVDDRERNLGYTFDVFKSSPLIGYSLGGVATAIGSMQGTRITGNNDAKQSEGGSVFAEVLAASGVIGIVPFILYLAALIRRPLAAGRAADPATSVVLSGLVWALCMELIILQFNQNVLRAYLWFHIGVVSAAFAAVRMDGWRAEPQAADGQTAGAQSAGTQSASAQAAIRQGASGQGINTQAANAR